MTVLEGQAPPVPATEAVAVVPTGRRRSSRQKASDSARSPLSPSRGVLGWVLATIALLVAWFLLYVLVLSPFQEQRRQSELYSQMRYALSQQLATVGDNPGLHSRGTEIPPGTPVAIMSIPSIGLDDVVVVEGTASGDLMSGPGHRRNTVLPGQTGVSVLYGRSRLFDGPFSQVSSLTPGAEITAVTGQGKFTYRVVDVRRPGAALPAPLVQGGSRLTLVTSDRGAGGLSPDGVVYVDALLHGDAQPYPVGRPAVVPTAETAMQGDPSALLGLALTLPLLAGALVFLVIARSRWGGWQTWLIGVPLVIAALWAVSQNVVQLLPNLL